jgi:hypothetical protein
MTLLSEAAVVLGDLDRARVLYEKLRPYEGLVGLVGGEVSAGPVSRTGPPRRRTRGPRGG